MNNAIYKIGLSLLRLADSVPMLPRSLDLISRTWQRNRKLGNHLRALHFDAVVDGGANVGEFAAVVRSVLPQAELICVEPHPVCAAGLRQQGYKVVEAALWKESGRLRLRQPTGDSTSSTVINGATVQPNDSDGWDVDAIRLDSLAIGGSRILVKLDLQGAEPQALEGMSSLWDRCAALLLEVSMGDGGTYEAIRSRLAARGYREYSTTNELEVDGRVREADKLWIRANEMPLAQPNS